jgi:hypothetical protein
VRQALDLVVQEHAVVLGTPKQAQQIRHRRQEPGPAVCAPPSPQCKFACLVR